LLSISRKDVFFSVLIVVLLAVAITEHVKRMELESQRPYSESDRKAIEAAFNAYVEDTGVSTEHMRNRFPVVIRFGAIRCVALELPRGWMGRTPVYCFDMNYNRVRNIQADAAEVVDVRPSSKGSADLKKEFP
jgi:hypothetical protein